MNPVLAWAADIHVAPPEPPPPPPPPPPAANIVWIGSPHYSSGRKGMVVIAIVVHTMAGTLRGSDGWFNNPAAQLSSQYGIGLGGEQHQYVTLNNTAWANGRLEPGNTWPGMAYNVNEQTVSIETDDNGSGATPVSEAQYQATLAVSRLALHHFPSIQWVLAHHTISPQSRVNCCGARWRDSGQFNRLANDLGLRARY